MKKKGISLIVLIITIIIIIVLAMAIILNITKNNPILSANKAVNENDIKVAQEAVITWIGERWLQEKDGIIGKEIGALYSGIVTKELSDIESNLDGEKTTIKTVLQDFDLVMLEKIEIKNNRIVSITKNGITYYANHKSNIIPPNEEIGEGTRQKGESAWNKPFIPSDFHYVEGTVETGYVIADEKQNEFVWIPIDGEHVKYETWIPSNHYHVENNEYPAGVTVETENQLVEKAGGFYIGRYEAGIPEEDSTVSNKVGIPVSKKGAIVWTDINYFTANSSAQLYKNNEEIASGFMSGKSWDTVCKWLQCNGYDVTDSRTYGNHNDSIEPANVVGYGKKQVSGYSENWKTKNIYDFAGNVWEHTYERDDRYRICHGGAYNASGNVRPVSDGALDNHTYTSSYSDVGFRVQLYIK